MNKRSTPTWENSRMDKSLRPPEVILGLPYSSKVDIWMLGCAVGFLLFSLGISPNLRLLQAYHMLTGKSLVPEEKAADDGIMLSWLIAMSGEHIPLDLSLKAGLRAKYFNENGPRILSYLLFQIADFCIGLFKLEIPEETLESQIIASRGAVPADDIPGIVKFVQTCLTMDPAKRPSPDDVFGNEWVEPGFES
jgi:serine/threonine protein kinase